MFEAYDENRRMTVAVKRTQKAGKIASREYEVMTMLRGADNVVQLFDYFLTIDPR